MSRLAAHLKKIGYELTEPFLRGRISPRERLTLHHESKAQARLLAIAFTFEDAVPLDMEVREDGGRPITEDKTPAHRSVVTFVADSQTRYEVRLRAGIAEKSAEFALALFEASLDSSSAAISDLFEHDPVPRLDLDGLTKRLVHLGFRPEQERFFPHENRTERIVVQHKLEPQRCHLFVAAGSRALESLHMRVEKSGHLLVRDSIDRPDAACHYCPIGPASVQVIIEVEAGTGDISYRTFSAPHRALRDVLGPTVQDAPPDRDPGCMFDSLAEELQALGFGPPPGPRKLTDLASGAARSVFFQTGLVPSKSPFRWAPIDSDERIASSEVLSIESGACRGFALTPAPPGTKLSLVSEDGGLLASSSAPIHDSLLLAHCAAQKSFVRLKCTPAASCREGALTIFEEDTIDHRDI